MFIEGYETDIVVVDGTGYGVNVLVLMFLAVILVVILATRFVTAHYH